MSSPCITPADFARAIIAGNPECAMDFALEVTSCVSKAVTIAAVAASRAKPITPGMDMVVSAVCETYAVTKAELMGRSKRRQIVAPRHMLWALLKSELRMGDRAIGGRVGSHHSTVRHGRERVDLGSAKWNELRRRVVAALRPAEIAEAAE